MSRYPFRANARAVVVSSVSSISAPTVAEVSGGVDITCDLVPSGLVPMTSTITDSHQPWHSDQVQEWPVWHGMSWELVGFRARQGDTESLWDACATFRGSAVLVVRWGLPSEQAWAAGQDVVVTRGRWGKRSMSSPGNAAATFSVVLYGSESTDAAVITS